MKDWNNILKDGRFYWVVFEKGKTFMEIVRFEGGVFHSTNGSYFTPRSCDHVDEQPIGLRGHHAKWF